MVDADGFVRTVKYTADPKEGFKAEVSEKLWCVDWNFRIMLLQVIREPTNIVVKSPKDIERQQQQARLNSQVKIRWLSKVVIVSRCFRVQLKRNNNNNSSSHNTTNEELISCCVLNYSHIYKDVFLYFFDNKKVNVVKQVWFYLVVCKRGKSNPTTFNWNILIMHDGRRLCIVGFKWCY